MMAVLILIVILVLLNGLQAQNKLGFTIPTGTVNLEVGSNLTITCVLNEVNHEINQNASFIYWEPETLTRNHVFVLNESAAQLFIPNVASSYSKFYSCILRTKPIESTVESNDIKIGHKASVNVSFGCYISVSGFNTDQHMEMICSWKLPQNNIITNYKVQYYRNKGWYICTKPEDKNSCRVEEINIPKHPEIRIKFNVSNSLNYEFQEFKFKRCNIMTFKDPPKITYANRKVRIQFPNITRLDCKGYAITCRVMLLNSTGSQNFSFDNITSYEKVFPLEDVNPFTNYTLNVSYQLSNSSLTDKWSTGSLNFTSETAVPSFPPAVTPGSFVAFPNGTYKIYWEAVPEMYHNDLNFSYVVECSNISLGSTTDCFYQILDFNETCEEDKTITIYSENRMGRSEKGSSISIADDLLPYPKDIDVFYSKTNSETYIFEISWNDVLEEKNNYTVFWCEIVESYHDCTTIGWETTSALSLNISLLSRQDPPSYRFAVVPQNDEQSSGIVWESCIMPFERNSKDQSITNLVVKDGFETTHYIDLNWEFPCERRSRNVEGFIVHWKWNSFENNSAILGIRENRYNITDIEDTTHYFIQVQTILKDGSNVVMNYSMQTRNNPSIGLATETQDKRLGTFYIILIVICVLVTAVGCLHYTVKKCRPLLSKIPVTLPSGLEDSNTTVYFSPPTLPHSPVSRKHHFPNTPLMNMPGSPAIDSAPSPTASQSSGIGSMNASDVEDPAEQHNTSSETDSDQNSPKEFVIADICPTNSCPQSEFDDKNKLLTDKNCATAPSASDYIRSGSALMSDYSLLGRESSPQIVLPESDSEYMKVGLNSQTPPVSTSFDNNPYMKIDIASGEYSRTDSANPASTDCYFSLNNLPSMNDVPVSDYVTSIPNFSMISQQNPYKTMDYFNKLPSETFTQDSVPCDRLNDSYAVIGEGKDEFNLNLTDDEMKVASICPIMQFIPSHVIENLSVANTNSNFGSNLGEPQEMNSFCTTHSNDCGIPFDRPTNESLGFKSNKGYVTMDTINSNSNTPTPNENPVVTRKMNEIEQQPSDNILFPKSDYVSCCNNDLSFLQSEPEKMSSKDNCEAIELPDITTQPQCTNLSENSINYNQSDDEELL